LKAIAVFDIEIAYCQGMNILTAYLLLVSDGNEVETFNIARYLFCLSSNIKLREFFLNGFPRLKMYIYLIKEIIRDKLPMVHEKLIELNIPDELWLFKWLQSLFVITLPFAISIRLWDCIFAYGIEFILSYTIAFIKYHEHKIIAINDIGDFLSCFEMKYNNEAEMINIRELLVKNAKDIKIDEDLILSLKLKFEKEESLKALNNNNFNKTHEKKSKHWVFFYRTY